jgi:SAM-dependent methyltransferase
VGPTQDQIFVEKEGNQWFRRNQAALEKLDPSADLPLRLLELYGVRPRRVLEVGAANGFRLAALAQRYGAHAVGCEPSADAIAAGRDRYPGIEFVQGQASKLPVAGPFDLVIVNFVFHWIDRSLLLTSVAEVDRVLEDGGLLLIGDFFPSNPLKVRYHHLPEVRVFTYKQDYAAVFLASGLYQSVCLLTADHSSRALKAEVSEDHRIATWLLRKGLGEVYRERSLPS